MKRWLTALSSQVAESSPMRSQWRLLENILSAANEARNTLPSHHNSWRKEQTCQLMFQLSISLEQWPMYVLCQLRSKWFSLHNDMHTLLTVCFFSVPPCNSGIICSFYNLDLDILYLPNGHFTFTQCTYCLPSCYVVFMPIGNKGQWFIILNGLSKEMSPVVKGRLSPSSWLITKLI